MKYSADCFYDDNRLMDVRVVSTLGLSQADLDDLAKIEGVLLARGSRTKEVLLTTGETVQVIRLISLTEGVNDPIISEGRLPENADECFIDADKLVKQGLRIGDRITVESGNDEELSESLTRDTFTIVGAGYLPYYIDLTRGTGSIGDGTIDAFIILDPAAFDMDVYTEIYLRVAKASEETTFEESYDALVKAVTDRIDALAEVAVLRRYDEVRQEAEEKLADAKKKVADGEKELADAESEIADGHEKIADAEKEIADKEQEIADGWKEIADGRQEIENGKKEISDAQAQLDDGWNQITQAEKDLAAGSSKLDDAKKQYAEGKESYEAGKAQYEDGKAQYEEGKKQYEEGLKQYEDGLAQYEDGKAQYDAGVAEYEAALAQYEDGLAQYEAGKAEYEDGLAQYEAGKAEYEAAKAEYEAGRAALDAQTEAYEAGKVQYEEGLAQYEEGLQQYQTALSVFEAAKQQYDAAVQAYEEALARFEAAVAAGELTPQQEAAARAFLEMQARVLAQFGQAVELAQAQLDDAKAQLDEAKAQLDEAAAMIALYEESKAALDAAEIQLAEADAQLKETEAQLAAGEAQLKETEAQLAAAKAELDAGKAQLDDTKEQLAAAKAQLDEAKKELDAGKTELDDSAKQLADAEKELADGKTQLDDAKAQIDSGEAELADGQAQIDANRKKLTDGQNTLNASKAELADGEAKLADGAAQLEDGEAQLADGKAELEDKKKELADAEKEFNDALPDARKEIQDGKDKIADGEKELAKLEVPEWYVLDRGMMESIISYEQNADRMDNLGTIFPVIFFLVAALVSLTAMTRMVDEQRMQIGTLKALGYSNGLIAGRYMLYAMMATIGGSIIGILFGEWFLPQLIIKSYGVMYTGQLYCFTPLNWKQAGLGIAAAALCTGGATLAACINQLRAQPASLMRPEAPAAGQRVFLEHIKPLWKHLSFTRKSTIRNLVRYKKRLIMTVIGVGGCMGLLLVGFGIHDSINEIAKQQYINIFRQDAVVTYESSSKPEERSALQQLAENWPGVRSSAQVGMVSVDLTYGGNIRSSYLYIPQEPDKISDYLSLRSRTTNEVYDYPEEGAVICEKTAKMLGLEVGDSVTITKDGERSVSVPVIAISENYILHYLFLSPQTYRELYGRDPEYNSLYLLYDDEVRENESAFGNYLMEQDACAGVSFTTDLENEIDDMLGILGNIVIVLIVAAGLLAFVVLYNLNSINIMERRRELATLKVLGFFDTEVAAYVYRENVILTVLGAALGVLIGAVLHRFVIVTVEVDLMMFGRNISPTSYLYSILLTFGFAVIVNLVMYYSLKKVDMIESLKSVE